MSTITLPEMDSADKWTESVTLKSYLARQLRRGRLALVLGAGTSKPFGLPEWDVLVKRLFDDAGVPVPMGLDALQAIDKFKTDCCADDEDKYKAMVKDALYFGLTIDLKTLRKSALLGALGALMMSSRRGSAEVITLNFDDLLERYLRYHGAVVREVAEPDDWSGNADVQVYHPHGCLPSDPRSANSKKIVFSDSEFLDAVGKPSWPWRARFESLLRSHTCIFLGVSGKDINLRSLMQDVRKIHSGIVGGERYWGVSFRMTTAENLALDSQWEKQAVYRQEISDYEEIPDWLFEICQIASEM